MALYRSNPIVSMNDKFVLSFDTEINGSSQLGIGVEPVKRKTKNVNLDLFLQKIGHGVVIDNTLELIGKSSTYQVFGNMIGHKTPTTSFFFQFGIEIIASEPDYLTGAVTYDVYEEVIDVSNFHSDVGNTDLLVKNDKIYQRSNKYEVVNVNGKLDVRYKASENPFTTIYAYEGGKIKSEEYRRFDNPDNLLELNGKLRFIYNNNSTILDITKRDEKGNYIKVKTFYFSTQLESGYIYLLMTGCNASNIMVTYVEGAAA